jgi:DNA invertase Pin-like site-specific DNA recombinase
MEIMKAAIYLRTSTDEQTPENQETPCLKFAADKGYDIEGVYIEKLSGYKDVKRPEYDKIKDKAKRREIDAVIVWALDRWVRNRDTLLDDVTILRMFGCKIHSVQEAWLEAINIEGSLGKTIQEFLLGLLGSIAEMESQRKSERVKLAYKRGRHKKWGRPSVHTNKKKIVIELRNQGLTYNQIKEKTKLSLGKISEILTFHKRSLDSSQINTPYKEDFNKESINENG